MVVALALPLLPNSAMCSGGGVGAGDFGEKAPVSTLLYVQENHDSKSHKLGFADEMSVRSRLGDLASDLSVSTRLSDEDKAEANRYFWLLNGPEQSLDLDAVAEILKRIKGKARGPVDQMASSENYKIFVSGAKAGSASFDLNSSGAF
jgi:hypothetical protein